MNTDMMQEAFLRRYDEIIQSGDTRQMERLGAMTKRVMRWLINEEPGVAEQAMAMIGADADATDTVANYLTEQEARAIVGAMQPAPAWPMEAMKAMLQGAGYQTAERPYYNEWALLAAMSMILSDDGETLRRVLGTPSHPASNEEMLAAVYQLALDRLKDRDGKFNIRKYFDLPIE